MNATVSQEDIFGILCIPPVFYTLVIHEIVTVTLMFSYTTYRLSRGTYTLRTTPILIVYFSILYIAMALRLGSGSVIASNLNNFLNAADKANILFTLSCICYEAFYSLMPNMFFSITQSKITKLKRGTFKHYWIINLAITILFIVVMIITLFLPTKDLWPSNIVLLIEIFYTMIFYIFVLLKLKNELPEVYKRLVIFFMDYLLFAVANIVCAVLRGLFPDLIAEDIAMHHVQESILLFTFWRSMSKLHLRGSEPQENVQPGGSRATQSEEMHSVTL